MAPDAAPREAVPPDAALPDLLGLDPQLLEILRCPACHGELRVDAAASELVCTGECGRAYPVRDRIPVLLVDEARLPG